MKFKGDIIITDPCYIDTVDSKLWDGQSFDIFSGSGLNRFGFTNYFWENTEYGDWSCTTLLSGEKAEKIMSELNEMYMKFFSDYNNKEVYETDENRKQMYDAYTAKRTKIEKDSGIILGNFCADAGLVGVFLLDEVLKFNPKFDYHINRLWTTTLIKDFDGDIVMGRDKEDGVSVIGKGNIDFYTTQSGL